MTKREREKAVFEAFLAIEPNFAGEPIPIWHQPDDEKEFPDIIGRSISGRRVGVELGEWLNQDQMQVAKAKERLEDSMLEAIRPQGSNGCDHIYSICLHPKPKSRVKPSDAGSFRQQLFDCIGECDQRWPDEPSWHSPQGAQIVNDELEIYPSLSKYLNELKLWPREHCREIRQWPVGIDWINFPSHGGPFDSSTMFEPLTTLISEKVNHYGTAGTGFDHLSLLVYYDQALFYNSPPETSTCTMDDAAAKIKCFLDGDLGPFHNVFLFIHGQSVRVG